MWSFVGIVVGTIETVVGTVVGAVIFCAGSVHFVSRSFNFKGLRIDNDGNYINTAVPTTEPATVRIVPTTVPTTDHTMVAKTPKRERTERRSRSKGSGRLGFESCLFKPLPNSAPPAFDRIQVGRTLGIVSQHVAASSP